MTNETDRSDEITENTAQPHDDRPRPKMRFTGTIMAVAIIAVFFLLKQTGLLEGLQ